MEERGVHYERGYLKATEGVKALLRLIGKLADRERGYVTLLLYSRFEPRARACHYSRPGQSLWAEYFLPFCGSSLVLGQEATWGCKPNRVVLNPRDVRWLTYLA